MKQLFKYQRPAAWWALFILLICNIAFSPKISNSHMFFLGFDKLVHCGLFFVFSVFAGAGLIRQYGARRFTFGTALKVFVVSLLFGGAIELLQLYVFTWRNGDWNDFFADSVGAGMGVFSTLVTLYASANAKD